MTPVTDPALLAQLNGGGMQPVQDPHLLALLNSDHPGDAPRVSDDMGTIDRLLAGYGRGVTELGQGAKQLALHAGGALGLADPSTVSGYDKQVADEAQLYNKDLGQTGAGKVGAFLGQAVTTAPLGAEAIVGKGLGLGASALRAAGVGAAQGALQPVTEGDYAASKEGQVGTGAAFGAGGTTALRGLGSLTESLLPANATAKVLNYFNGKANASPFAQEGEQLAAKTGVDLTPAQVSGSKAMSQAENAARQSIYSRDLAFQSDQRRTQQLADYFDRTMTGIANSDASPVMVGQQVRAATQNVLGKLEKSRSDQAAKDFGAVRAMTKGAATIEPQNTHALLQNILEENAGIGTPGGDALANFAKKQLANMAPPQSSAPAQVAAALDSGPKPLPPISGSNYVGPLSKFTNTLYREANPEGAELMLPNSARFSDIVNDPFFANTKEMATGQNGNVGVMMHFDPSNLRGQLNTKKPMWQRAYDNGHAEFTGAEFNNEPYKQALKAIEIDPSKLANDPYTKRLYTAVTQLEGSGWKKSTSPDGKIVYTKPSGAPDPSPNQFSQLQQTAPAQGNLDKLMQLRSYLSKVAGGQAKISGENQDRRVAAQLLGTIDQDIEHAGDTLGGDLGGALKAANRNYRIASQAIESVHASPLGKILGEDFTGALQSGQFNTIPPEVVSQRLNDLKPSQLAVVRGLLEKQDPETWAVMKRGILQDAIEKAQIIPASEGANTAVLRPNVLVKNLGDAKRLQAVFDPAELSQIKAGLDTARRLADRTGYNTSNTAGTAEVLSLMNNPLGAARNLINKGLGAVAHVGTAGMGAKAVAQIMSDAKGRAALLQLKTLPPSSAKARELTTYLASLAGARSTDQPDQGQQ